MCSCIRWADWIQELETGELPPDLGTVFPPDSPSVELSKLL